jgi:protein-disulfide isomerase
MAKNKNKTNQQNTDSDQVKKVNSNLVEDESDIEISLEEIAPYLTPIAIVISAIMISLSVFFSLRNMSAAPVSTAPPVSDPNVAEEEFQPTVAELGDAAYLGDTDAKVALIEFSDYECPFCQRHHQQTYSQLIENYVDTGEIIYAFRDFPLNFHDPKATEAAVAARCMRDQEGDVGFFKFTSAYFNETASNGQGLVGKTEAELAEELGANKGQFEKCMDEKFDSYAQLVQEDMAAGQQFGVTGTPGFIIGLLSDDGSVDGVLVPGAYPYESIAAVIEEQLAR